MKIGIDARVLDKKITGTGRFLLNLLNELPRHDKKNEYFLYTNSNLLVDRDFYTIVNYTKSLIPFKIFSPYWLNFILPKLLTSHKIDILFSPNILIPLIDLKQTKTVAVLHDVIPKIYKEYYPFLYRQYLSFFLPKSLKKTNIIVTVSTQSKKDIEKYYNVVANKIKVIYNTASDNFKPISLSTSELQNFKNKYTLPDKYLLYVGAIEKRKNIEGIINIMDVICKAGSNLNLILIGRPGYGSKEILNAVAERQSYIKYFNYVEDNDLQLFYNTAFAFLFPSFYEGFGIPPLEAMQTGLPVLASSTSSLSEVVGEGGYLTLPEDITGFAENILTLEKDADYYKKMKAKALIQARKFNIQDITKKLVEIFNNLNIK